MNPAIKEGDVFNRLTALEADQTKKRHWRCQCVCGKIAVVLDNKLHSGHTRSCGCLHREVTSSVKRTHGRSKTSEHRIWSLMIQRCENPKNPAYPDYGGRGIAVCKEWRSSFEAFFLDMGEKPEGGTLDRRDNNLGYSPDNCRWSTRQGQARNRRSDGRITYGGRSLMPVEWAEEIGSKSNTIRQRIRSGWSVGRALGFE